MNRVEGRDKVTGRARYACEYPADDVAYAYPVQSRVARGRILAVDPAAALAEPGVLAVLSGQDPPELGQDVPPGLVERVVHTDAEAVGEVPAEVPADRHDGHAREPEAHASGAAAAQAGDE